jgi:TRAP-type mannitol/chloroaromatic compound transport system substrate-binding protein
MKRRDFIKVAAIAAPAAALAAPAVAQGKIEWKLPTSFPAKAPGVGTNSASFADRVAKMSDGRLTFKIFSGGELVPSFAVEDAVQQGTAEIGHSTPFYAASKNSANHFFGAIPFGMMADEYAAWLGFGGGQALWDELYAQRNLVPFYSGNSGIQSGGWFKKPINSLSDLSGLNMRIGGLGGEVMRKVGVNAVITPPPEIFPAFKSGALDAAEWVGPFLDQGFGLSKVANYCYFPSFQEPNAAMEIVVNKDAYDELPGDLQAIIANAAAATSVETLSQFNYFDAVSFQKLKDDGVVFGEFPEDVVEALKAATGEVMDENAADNPDFAKIRESYDAYLDLAKVYSSAYIGSTLRQRS